MKIILSCIAKLNISKNIGDRLIVLDISTFVLLTLVININIVFITEAIHNVNASFQEYPMLQFLHETVELKT